MPVDFDKYGNPISPRNKYDAKRGARIVWLAEHFSDKKTDAKLVLELMANFPGTSQQTARADLREIYRCYYEMNQDSIVHGQAKALDMAYKCYEDCVNMCQMSAAVRILEHIHKLQGLLTDKFKVEQVQQSTPAPDIVRERIKTLMAKKKIQEDAEQAEIDLEELASKADIEY